MSVPGSIAEGTMQSLLRSIPQLGAIHPWAQLLATCAHQSPGAQFFSPNKRLAFWMPWSGPEKRREKPNLLNVAQSFRLFLFLQKNADIQSPIIFHSTFICFTHLGVLLHFQHFSKRFLLPLWLCLSALGCWSIAHYRNKSVAQQLLKLMLCAICGP